MSKSDPASKSKPENAHAVKTNSKTTDSHPQPIIAQPLVLSRSRDDDDDPATVAMRGRWALIEQGRDDKRSLMYGSSPPSFKDDGDSEVDRGEILDERSCGDVIEANLRSSTSFFVEQQIELLEVITGFETENHYLVWNNRGRIFLDARERSGCCWRLCCGPNRRFKLEFTDASGRMVMSAGKDFNCCFVTADMEVYYPEGVFLGSIRRALIGRCCRCLGCCPELVAVDQDSRVVLNLRGGGLCTQPICCNDVEFDLCDEDDAPIGSIVKIWSGCCQETFTDATVLGARFPVDLSLEKKVLVLAMTFMLDFVYYEGNRNRQQNRNNNR